MDWDRAFEEDIQLDHLITTLFKLVERKCSRAPSWRNHLTLRLHFSRYTDKLARKFAKSTSFTVFFRMESQWVLRSQLHPQHTLKIVLKNWYDVFPTPNNAKMKISWNWDLHPLYIKWVKWKFRLYPLNQLYREEFLVYYWQSDNLSSIPIIAFFFKYSIFSPSLTLQENINLKQRTKFPLKPWLCIQNQNNACLIYHRNSLITSLKRLFPKTSLGGPTTFRVSLKFPLHLPQWEKFFGGVF